MNVLHYFPCVLLLGAGCIATSSQSLVAINTCPNSIIEDNRTTDFLYVSRNGKPWMMEMETDMKVQKQIPPKHIAILSDCSTNIQEKIALDFEAINMGQRGCIRFMNKTGVARWTVNVGTSSRHRQLSSELGTFVKAEAKKVF